MEGRPGLRLARIRAYPLKGAGGFDLTQAGPDDLGIPGDRRWMLVGPEGGFLSQRTHPRLSLIRLRPGGGDGGEVGVVTGKWFWAGAPGMEPLALRPPPLSEESVEVRVHEDRFGAQPAGLGESQWFSNFLGEVVCLVYFPDHLLRPVDPGFAPGHRVGFADGYPIHVTTEESLAELNRRLTQPSSMLRFRPNLVVRGAEPWDEDEWRVVEVGEARLGVVKPCARCAVPSVDPRTATRGREPMRTLSSYRKWEEKVYFGQNAVFLSRGGFRVGDEVRIVERGSPRPPLSRPQGSGLG